MNNLGETIGILKAGAFIGGALTGVTTYLCDNPPLYREAMSVAAVVGAILAGYAIVTIWVASLSDGAAFGAAYGLIDPVFVFNRNISQARPNYHPAIQRVARAFDIIGQELATALLGAIIGHTCYLILR